MYDYIKNGQEIYNNSFEIIRRESNLTNIPQDLEKLAVRVIHACGMPDIVEDLRFSAHAGAIGRQALSEGCAIFCDSNMVAHGVSRHRLPCHNDVICTLRDREVAQLAEKTQNTRSASAIELWGPRVENSVVAIGNAPTALFYLLELIKNGLPRPALILGFPVGFVGAAESKQALAENPFNIPFVTLLGRRGGSAMAAASINALAMERE